MLVPSASVKNRGVTMRAIADRLSGPQHYRTTRKHTPLLARFGSKLVLDILPAALASVIGGILFTHFQISRMTSPPAAEQTTPVSAEVLALVRDEHDAIIGYLKSAAEQNRLAAQDAETARAVADAKAEKEKAIADLAVAETRLAEVKVASIVASRSAPAPVVQPKLAPPRTKPAAASGRAPLVIAQAGQQSGQAAEQNVAQNDAAPASDRLARDPDSLRAKTLDLKDQVVAATRNAVAAIGDVFASVGERFGGAASSPTSRQFSSDS